MAPKKSKKKNACLMQNINATKKRQREGVTPHSHGPGRGLFITRLGLGAYGGANGLVPLLPASMREPDKAIRIALGERHAEKCAMRKTLSGGFWTVSFACATIFVNIARSGTGCVFRCITAEPCATISVWQHSAGALFPPCCCKLSPQQRWQLRNTYAIISGGGSVHPLEMTHLLRWLHGCMVITFSA